MRTFPAALALLALAGCSEPKMAEVSPPPGVHAYAEYPFGTATASLEGALEQAVRSAAGRGGGGSQITRYAAPRDLTRAAAAAYLAQTLGSTWRRAPQLEAGPPSPYWTVVFENGPRRVVAGAVASDSPATETPFLIAQAS